MNSIMYVYYVLPYTCVHSQLVFVMVVPYRLVSGGVVLLCCVSPWIVTLTLTISFRLHY